MTPGVNRPGWHARKLALPCRSPGSYRKIILQEKGANLVDHRGAVVNEPITDAMQCLKIELFLVLDRHAAHARAVDRFGDRQRIIEVVLVRFHEGANKLGWDDAHIMTVRDQRASKWL